MLSSMRWNLIASDWELRFCARAFKIEQQQSVRRVNIKECVCDGDIKKRRGAARRRNLNGPNYLGVCNNGAITLLTECAPPAVGIMFCSTSWRRHEIISLSFLEAEG
jgi:hypothetical protein